MARSMAWYSRMCGRGQSCITSFLLHGRLIGSSDGSTEFDEIITVQVEAMRAALALLCDAVPGAEESAWDYMHRMEATWTAMPSPVSGIEGEARLRTACRNQQDRVRPWG